jgi:hypothetical protein
LQVFRLKEEHRNFFFPKRRIFFECCADRSAPMLAIIDNELKVFELHL